MAYPGLRTGLINVFTGSSILGNDVYFKFLLCQDCIHRIDFITGWNYTRLNDDLQIRSRQTVTETGGTLAAACAEADVDVIISDIRMAQLDGMQFLKTLKGERAEIPVVLATAFGSMNYTIYKLDTKTAQVTGFNLPTGPVKPYQQNGGPLLYFGGYSEDGQDLCAEHCDVYLMWPDTEKEISALIASMDAKAERYGRRLHYGLRDRKSTRLNSSHRT